MSNPASENNLLYVCVLVIERQHANNLHANKHTTTEELSNLAIELLSQNLVAIAVEHSACMHHYKCKL